MEDRMKRNSLIALALLLSTAVNAQPVTDPLGTSYRSKPVVLNEEPDARAISPGVVALTSTERLRLLSAGKGATIRLPSVDAFTSQTDQPLQFQRFEPFAPGARIMLVNGQTSVEMKPRNLHYFLASNRTTGIGLAFDADTGEISGFATKAGEKLQVYGAADIGLEFNIVEQSPEASNLCGTENGDQPMDALAFINEEQLSSQSALAPGESISYQAVIAVDTDTEWVSGRGGTANAMTFITDIFLAMNVFFERDIETRLLIGDVILRTGTDPYTVATGRSAQLDEFADYWRVNQGAIDRDFATMFAGRDIGQYSFSGIAWVNQYCNKGYVQGSGGNARTVGSYSYNAIGTRRTTANTALFVGHELGHSMGSSHTHCYSPPVDQCYKNESGCYSGTPSCPAGGRATVMSYCHFSTNSGGAGCGNSNLEFHPTVQSRIEGRMASNSPSCIAPFINQEPGPEQVIFGTSFE